MQSSNPIDKIDSLVESLEDFNPDTHVLAIVVDQFSDLVKKMNSSRITEKSKFVSGATITPNYHPYTAKRKGTFTPDLFETGAFSRSFEIEHDDKDSVDGGTIDIFNTDSKYQAGLLSKYEVDGDLIGITEEDKSILSDKVKPFLVNKFRKAIFG